MTEIPQDTLKEEEFQIDTKKIKNFLINNKKTLTLLALLLIPLFFSFYFRVQPANLPITDKWAEDSIYNTITNDIRASINAQYPNLPDANKNNLVNEELNKIGNLYTFKTGTFKGQTIDIQQQIEQGSKSFKSNFQDDNGNTYLLAIDPYTFYRQTRKLITDGHTWDAEINGTAYNMHRTAPIGSEVSSRFKGARLHIWVEYLTFRITHLFSGIELDNLDSDLMGTIFYIPIILSMLSVIPAFFLGRKLSGEFGGFTAAFLVAIHPAFVNRTAGGFADTDAYNVLFPLLMVTFFLFAFYAKDWKKYLYASLAGISTGLYAWVWSWWYTFDFMLAGAVIFLAYSWYNKDERLKDYLKVFAVFLTVSAVVVSFFASFATFLNAPIQPVKSLAIKEVTKSTLWPNVYRTVAELNQASISSIISTMGGTLLMVLSLIGILLLFLERKVHEASLFLLWFAGTVFTATKGIRFTLLLVPVFALGIGILAGWLYKKGSKLLEKEFNIQSIISKVVVVLLILVILMPMTLASWTQASEREIPSMDDAWYNTLTKIKDNSQEDAIINSWWDFGHWFKAVADRGVTFDGASQNTPMAHWIGKVLLTSNEEEANGLLRMLDCGSNNAFEQLNKVKNNTPKSVDLLYKIVVSERESAKSLLTDDGLNDDQAEAVLRYTHCDPPENFFITSGDMVSKSGVWSHFGSWNFTKAAMFRDVSGTDRFKGVNILKEKYNLEESQAEKIYFEIQSAEEDKWIAPWPSYASNHASCSVANNIATCGNGLVVDLNTKDTYLAAQQGKVTPYSLTYQEGDELKERLFKNKSIDVSASLIRNGNSYSSVLMSKELALSTFNRLFYYNGFGSKYFEHFDSQRSPTGTVIHTWKVNWDGKAKESLAEQNKEIRASHILLNTEEEAQEILNLLNNGSDFAELAKEKSVGPSAPDAGDLGYFTKGVMVKEFEDAAFALENIGDISGIVQTQFGYHIIQLTGKR